MGFGRSKIPFGSRQSTPIFNFQDTRVDEDCHRGAGSTFAARRFDVFKKLRRHRAAPRA
jgi:hypothetical protein